MVILQQYSNFVNIANHSKNPSLKSQTASALSDLVSKGWGRINEDILNNCGSNMKILEAGVSSGSSVSEKAAKKYMDLLVAKTGDPNQAIENMDIKLRDILI